MTRCSYCGRENNDTAISCGGCGATFASGRAELIPLKTPHHMLGDIMHAIWGYFGPRCYGVYIGGFLIGMFGPIGMALHDPSIFRMDFPFGRLPAAVHWESALSG